MMEWIIGLVAALIVGVVAVFILITTINLVLAVKIRQRIPETSIADPERLPCGDEP